MFENFCRRNAAVSDFYDGKSKNKNCRRIFFLIPMAVMDAVKVCKCYKEPKENYCAYFII